MQSSPPRLFAFLLVAASLAACGGGGSKKNPNASLDIEIGGSGYSSGDRITGIQPGQELNIRFMNSGSDSVRLDPVLFEATDELDVRDFELLSESNYSSLTAGSPPPESELRFPGAPLSSDPVFGEVFLPDAASIGQWAAAAQRDARPRLIPSFPMPDGETADLILRPLPSPFAAGAQVVVDGQVWADAVTEVLAGFSAWTGEVVGDPGSTVFLSFSPRGSRGWMHTDDEVILLGTEPDPVQGWDAARQRIWRLSSLQAVEPQSARDFRCGLVPPPVREPGWTGGTEGDDILQSPGSDGDGDSEGLAASVGAVRRCQLGFETDEDFFDQFGDNAAATTYVAQLVAAVGHRYQQRIQTQLEMVYLRLYDTESDPWVAPDTAGSAEDLLEEFADHWGNNWPGAAADADLGHLLCNGMNEGGIAYYSESGTLCSRTGGFGVSTGITTGAVWSSFDFDRAVGYWDFVVVAHEIGHNFGTAHTHDYCPPFDECSQAFGVCQTQRDCVKGTILSYCHTCVGGLNRIDPDFEPYIATVMRRVADDSCLSPLRLNPGDALEFTVIYEPKTAGVSEVEMRWTHNASNLPSPFTLILEGE